MQNSDTLQAIPPLISALFPHKTIKVSSNFYDIYIANLV